MAEPQVREAPAPVCDTVKRRRVGAFALATLFFAFWMVARNDIFIRSGYELTELKRTESELTKNIEYVQVNLAKARSPERIIAKAEQLGMMRAEGNFYVRLVPEGNKERPDAALAWNSK